MKEVTISPNDAGQRLDKFLQKAYPDLPLSLLYKYVRRKRVKLNGKRAEASARLAVGDCLRLYIGDEFLGGGQAGRPLFLSVPPAVEVVYEDENLLLLNKPAGLLCHEDAREKRDTLVNRLLRYLYEAGEYDPAREQSFAPALCNRIDRNTQGLVLAAKNARALREADEALRQRLVEKRYLCITLCQPPARHAVLRGYHTKDAAGNLVQITDSPRPGAKTALTEYTLLDTRDGLALLEVVLHTGRTHQIRSHLAHIGCPLLGDTKYGTNRQNAGRAQGRQALCSYALRFGPLPQDFAISPLAGRTFRLGEVGFVREHFQKSLQDYGL